MRQLFSRADLHALSITLALVMLLGSSPLSAGLVVRSGPGHPEITADICLPMQTFNLVSNTLLARPASAMPESILCNLGVATAPAAIKLIEYHGAPETPPPKSPV